MENHNSENIGEGFSWGYLGNQGLNVILIYGKMLKA